MSKTILFSIIGALTGVVISQTIIHFDNNKNIVVVAFALFLSVASFSLILEKISKASLIKSLSFLSIVLAGITLYFFSQGYNKIRNLSPILVIGMVQLTIICTTYFQTWKANKPHFSYDDLFENAWNNHFFYIFSGLLTGGFLLILGLGGQLFDMLGIKASSIIWNRNVTLVIVGALLGAGVGISREHDQLIFKFRGLFFALFRILAYLTAGIVILFTFALPFSIENLLAHKDTSLILLSIVAISIILLNALEDTDSDDLPKWSHRIFSIQLILLPILIAVSVYAIYLRIQQYGLMPNRIIALWMALLMGAYTIAYLFQLIINKGRWKLGFSRINPPLAFIWVASIILLASPILDPVKLSVNNQVSRLQNNHVDPETYDFFALKNRLGKRGKQGIEEILSWTNHPQAVLIKERIKQTKSKSHDKILSITVIGEEPQNIDLIKRHFGKWRCNQTTPCFIKNVKLNETNGSQPMVFYFNKVGDIDVYKLETNYYQFKNNRWTVIRNFKSRDFNKKRMEEIIQSIKNHEPTLIKPLYSDFEINGIELRN